MGTLDATESPQQQQQQQQPYKGIHQVMCKRGNVTEYEQTPRKQSIKINQSNQHHHRGGRQTNGINKRTGQTVDRNQRHNNNAATGT